MELEIFCRTDFITRMSFFVKIEVISKPWSCVVWLVLDHFFKYFEFFSKNIFVTHTHQNYTKESKPEKTKESKPENTEKFINDLGRVASIFSKLHFSKI